MKTKLDVKNLPSRDQEGQDLATKRQQASIKAWRSIFPAKIDRGEIPKKMTPALRAFLDENPDYAAKVEQHYVRDMSEAEQTAAIAVSWRNLRTIKNPLDKIAIMAVALDARAYDALSAEAKRSPIIQTIMLRKDGAYIDRIAPEDLNEDAVLAAVRRNFEIFVHIGNPTQAMISAAVAQFEKNIGKDVHAASLIYKAVAPYLSSEMREHAEREFILNRCESVIDKREYYRGLKDKLDNANDNERPAAYYAANRLSFSGCLSAGMSTSMSRFTLSNIEYLSGFAEHVKSLNITWKYGDFNNTIPAHANDFLFLDPPYALNKGNDLYGVNGEQHEGFEHAALAALLKKHPYWLLCYNDCRKVRDLYDGYCILKVSWAYGMTTKASSEVFILSHRLEQELRESQNPTFLKLLAASQPPVADNDIAWGW